MASTLDGYIRYDGHKTEHLREWLSAKATDLEWMAKLAEASEDWIVITGDLRIHRNKAERQAFRRLGLRGIALAPAYQKTPMSRICAMLVDGWPRILTQVGALSPPFLLEMPIKFGAKFRSLPL